MPSWRSLPIDETTHLDDKRNFTGLYADLNVAVTDAWHVEAGLRFNHTREKRSGFGVDLTGDAPELFEVGREQRSDNRLSGALGTSYRFWQDGRDYLTGYASYRNTFKPAVIDFGPEPESEILEPEDAQSGELGLKGRNMDGRFEWDLSVFRMNFHNLVVSQNVEGLPGLTNAGNERFKGAEAEARWNVTDGLSLFGTYAYHDARFADYAQLFGETLTQLDGNMLELSPQHLSSLGLVYGAEKGLARKHRRQLMSDRASSTSATPRKPVPTGPSMPASAMRSITGKCAWTATTCPTGATRWPRANSAKRSSTVSPRARIS